jgi:hypothetical protein
VLDQYRVTGQAFSPNAEIYEIREVDNLNPELPVLVRLDVTVGGRTANLSSHQPGPWDEGYSDFFVDLGTLVTLGKLAEELIATKHL